MKFLPQGAASRKIIPAKSIRWFQLYRLIFVKKFQIVLGAKISILGQK